jgi:hypothetical protein
MRRFVGYPHQPILNSQVLFSLQLRQTSRIISQSEQRGIFSRSQLSQSGSSGSPQIFSRPSVGSFFFGFFLNCSTHTLQRALRQDSHSSRKGSQPQSRYVMTFLPLMPDIQKLCPAPGIVPDDGPGRTVISGTWYHNRTWRIPVRDSFPGSNQTRISKNQIQCTGFSGSGVHRPEES